MSILFSRSSSSILLPLKLIIISTTIVSAAVVLKFSGPALVDLAATDVPSIYNCVVSWLRPPYLYLVINCIIITIVASSKLQSKLNHDAAPSPPTPPLEFMTPPPVQFQYPQPEPEPVVLPLDPIKQQNFESIVLKSEALEAVKPEEFDYPLPGNNIKGNDLRNDDDKENQYINVVNDAKADATSNYVDDSSRVISKPSQPATTMTRRDSSEFLFSSEKPPAGARVGHRRAVKVSPEGGGKTVLGVSKSKRQDTLESTWKTITEGRAMPLTRHLKKSDTWETHAGGSHRNLVPQNHRMTKSETFHDRSNANGGSSTNSVLTRSPGDGPGKLKKEASLGQDELNRRVEAFIKKFNEEMRLQRQESLNQYMEMINRGAH